MTLTYLCDFDIQPHITHGKLRGITVTAHQSDEDGFWNSGLSFSYRWVGDDPSVSEAAHYINVAVEGFVNALGALFEVEIADAAKPILVEEIQHTVVWCRMKAEAYALKAAKKH